MLPRLPLGSVAYVLVKWVSRGASEHPAFDSSVHVLE